MHQSGDRRSANSHERVEYPVPLIGQGQYQALNQFYGKLAGMNRLLDMIGFYIMGFVEVVGRGSDNQTDFRSRR